MGVADSIQQLNSILERLMKDMVKVGRGNKAAAQRVRVGTIKLERVAKQFRKDSIYAEKRGHIKKRRKKKHLDSTSPSKSRRSKTKANY